MEYRARIEQDEGGYWLVEFPDCPGCQTFGKSREEALERAREALEGWLEAHLATGRVPPRPAAGEGEPIRIGLRLEVALELRWWRQARGLTQAEVAKLAGVSQQRIARLEDPEGNPTLATLERVTTALGIRLEVTLDAA